MSLLFGETSYGWTIATLVVFGILLGMFVGIMADTLAYSISSIINALSLAHKAAWNALNNTEVEQKYNVTIGNYTYSINKPVAEPFMDSPLYYLHLIIYVFATLVSTPHYLALLLGITLIIIALEMEVK